MQLNATAPLGTSIEICFIVKVIRFNFKTKKRRCRNQPPKMSLLHKLKKESTTHICIVNEKKYEN